jgi:hypothetical protein
MKTASFLRGSFSIFLMEAPALSTSPKLAKSLQASTSVYKVCGSTTPVVPAVILGESHVFTHDEGGPQPAVTGGASTTTIDVVVKTAYKSQCLRGFLV